MWLQSLVVALLQSSRLSTATGTDVDTFVADFGMTRIAAISATGSVTFSRTSTTNQAVIPAGNQVQSADGTQTFTVIADTNQAAWNAGLNAYVIASGTASCTATVQAVSAGAQGNVNAGTITVLLQAIQFVSTVTNAAAFTNGANQETDAALKVRFVLYMNTLARATKLAIQNAVEALGPTMTAYPVEGYTYAGSPTTGYFYVIVDDGTGAPSSTVLTNAWNAIDAIRAFGAVKFDVYAPVIVTANVAMTITTATGYTHSTITAQVQAALEAYINALPLGTPLPYSVLASVAYGASSAVTNVTGVTLNSGTADLAATVAQVIKHGTVTVS
jgi:uncharacterized phage protein gp47/JayE